MIIRKLTVATAGVALSLVVVAKPTQAAILNYNFTVDVDPTSSFIPGAIGSGSFSFDDSNLTDSASVPVESLSFKFNGSSIVYTEKDDLEYPTFPVVFSTTSFSGGSSVGLNYDFINKEAPSSSVEFSVAGDYLAIFAAASSGTQIGSGKVSYSQVPEPMSVSSVLITGGIGYLIKRKAAASQKAKA